MSTLQIEWTVAVVYASLGIGAWALLGFVMIKSRSRMEILREPIPPLPNPAPKVSVLVPAKDESHQIENCLRSILSQNYPAMEIIAIDDRSSDGTGEILDSLAAKDARLRVIHIRDGELPTGWGGKSFALHRGMEAANGEWILFVDADVTLRANVITATIAWATKREFDLISLLPAFQSGTFAEGVLQPLAGAATSGMFLIALTNSPEWKTAFANGQYLCVKKSAYDAIGGHAAVRGTLSEDVALARKLKSAGFRPRLGWGDAWADVRMYDSFTAIFRGWSRNFYVGSLGKPWRILALLAFIFCCCYSFIPAAAWGVYRNAHPINQFAGWGWIGCAAAHYLLMTIIGALMYDWAGEPKWYSLLMPIGLAVLVAISIKSLWLCVTGKVEWRGTQYSKHDFKTEASHAGN